MSVVCMPLSSKSLTESTGKKIVKLIIQYLAKIWIKCNSLLFWPEITNIVSGGTLNPTYSLTHFTL